MPPPRESIKRQRHASTQRSISQRRASTKKRIVSCTNFRPVASVLFFFRPTPLLKMLKNNKETASPCPQVGDTQKAILKGHQGATYTHKPNPIPSLILPGPATAVRSCTGIILTQPRRKTGSRRHGSRQARFRFFFVPQLLILIYLFLPLFFQPFCQRFFDF